MRTVRFHGECYSWNSQDRGIFIMKPSSDHELEIARVVDERASQGNLPVTAIAEIAAQIPFTMSESETQFLIRYVVWRRDNPIRTI